MIDSRISGLHKLNAADRIAELERRGILSAADARALLNGRQVLATNSADKMVENVLGVFGLPLAVAPNFVVNGRDYVVPLVIEEPSVVAALSNAAARARQGGGFTAMATESLLAGQIHLVGIKNGEAAKAAIIAAQESLLAKANEVHPRLQQRGGGAREIEVRALEFEDGAPLLAVHVLIDTCDAMGANLVNTICEAIAPDIAALCSGDIALRILSNLADRSIVSARVSYATDQLTSGSMSGEQVRDGIVAASNIATVDPYRAATHNKGVMNGIDALAIATGNDWRAIEAGIHAYASRSGHYRGVTRWTVGVDGNLIGEIEVPIKVGIVGGTLATNSAAKLALAISGVRTARELAELMASVGLAQNFSALRALATHGIQEGHMRMHARSVASAAGASTERLEQVVDALVASGEVKSWKAREILASLDADRESSDATSASSSGKIILLGEHAVVYGHHALALPIPGAVRAAVTRTEKDTVLSVFDWGLRVSINDCGDDGAAAAVKLIIDELGLTGSNFAIELATCLPRGMGLGSSAAIAVAIIRAIARHQRLEISDEQVNAIAFNCEKLSHGTPSGVDNTISCFGAAMLFNNKSGLKIEQVSLAETTPLVIGFSHSPGPTREQVAGVKQRRDKNPQRYDAIFEQINQLSIDGAKALREKNYAELGAMMNIAQGLLNAIGVSTPRLEDMVDIARSAGALGAKLTGAGGGGSIAALCPQREDAVRDALHQAGYATLEMVNDGVSG